MEDFAGRALAIDAFNTLYQFLSIIRQPDGTPLMDPSGNITSHLAGLLYRTANMVEAGIRPVFVFDGPPHPLKRNTLQERSRRKVEAAVVQREAIASGDLDRAKSAASQTARLTSPMIGQAQKLLDALGLPWVEAPGEGEAQASAMARDGTAYAAVSQDFDSLLFGTPRLVRNLAVTGRRKLPGRRAFVDVEPETIDLADSLKSLKISREQLVDIGILVGTDFNAGIHGVGPKRALKLIQDHGTLERVFAHLGQRIEGADAVRELFLEPKVSSSTIEWKAPREAEVLDLLVVQHAFSEERVRTALARYAALTHAGRQRSLDTFFQ
jgi:flap endonuclease-1